LQTTPRLRIIADKMNPPNFELTMMSIRGPVWLPPNSPAAELFPAKPDAPAIALMAGTVEAGADAGRVSRAIPLYLAERIEFSTTATTRSLFPYATKPLHTFVCINKRIEDQTAAGYARQGQEGRAADYVITTHLLRDTAPWTVELRLVRSVDARCVMETSVPCSAAGLDKFEAALRACLASATNIAAAKLPASYQPPPDASLPAWLTCSEQLLAIRAATTFKTQNSPLADTIRDILTNQLHLCAQLPRSVPARLLLFQSLASLNEIRTASVREFKERVNTLQNENPLPSPAQQTLLNRLFGSLFP